MGPFWAAVGEEGSDAKDLYGREPIFAKPIGKTIQTPGRYETATRRTMASTMRDSNLSIRHWTVFSLIYVVSNLVCQAAFGELTGQKTRTIVVAGVFFCLFMSLTRPFQQRIDAGVERLFSRWKPF